MRGLGCRSHALGGARELVRGLSSTLGHIFDGTSGKSGLDGTAHGVGNPLRIVRVTVLEIGAHRQSSCGNQRSRMFQHHIASNRSIGFSQRKSKSRASRGQRFKSQRLQQSRAARVPWIGDDECPVALMQCAKCLSFFCLSRHESSANIVRGDGSTAFASKRHG